MLNICTDRYRFCGGPRCGGVLAKKITLLPSTLTAPIICQLAQFAPDAFCLTDDPRCDVALPRFYYPGEACRARASLARAQIDSEQIVAYVFTSGSTGVPIPHKKTWGRLMQCVREGARRLGHADGRSYAMLGTVPAQHMYGFESTVLVCLQSGIALCAERPFLSPADILREASNACRVPGSWLRPR